MHKKNERCFKREQKKNEKIGNVGGRPQYNPVAMLGPMKVALCNGFLEVNITLANDFLWEHFCSTLDYTFQNMNLVILISILTQHTTKFVKLHKYYKAIY